MRTIEFRGKRVDNGEWVYGSLITGVFLKSKTKEDIPYILDISNIGYDCFEDIQEDNGIYEVVPETVGQFTGLHDKNGKEIYEGDVVKVGDMKVMIRWNNKASSFYGLFMIGSRQMDTVNLGCLTSDDEIIGNIHDNPELLKEVSHEA